MQKNTKNASILIWAIFLSIIISVAFLAISTKINKSIKENSSFTYPDLLNEEIKKGTYKNTTLENGEQVIFESNKLIVKNLKQDEEYNIYFEQTNDTIADLHIVSGGPIKYNFTDKNNNNYSGLITDFKTIDITTGSGILNIKNIGGYTNFILSGATDFIAEDKKYKVIKQIGNKDFIKTTGEIKLN